MNAKSQTRAFSGAYADVIFNAGTEGALFAKSLMNLSQVVDSFSEDGQKTIVSNLNCHWEIHHGSGSLVEGCPVGITFGVLQTAGLVSSTPKQTTTMHENAVLGQLTDDVFGYQRINNPKYTSIFWRLDVGDGQGDNYHYFKANGNFNIPRNVLALLNKESETERLQDLYLVVVVNTVRDINSTISGNLRCNMTADYTLKRQTIKVR